MEEEADDATEGTFPGDDDLPPGPVEAGPLVVQLHGLTSSRDRDAQLGLDLARSLRGHGGVEGA